MVLLNIGWKNQSLMNKIKTFLSLVTAGRDKHNKHGEYN